jgi:hypothetical protein
MRHHERCQHGQRLIRGVLLAYPVLTGQEKLSALGTRTEASLMSPKRIRVRMQRR